MEMNVCGLNLHNTVLDVTAGAPNQILKDGLPQIALSGRSNVGKSSLVNCLLGRKKLARVSSEPGKTITVNFYLVDKSLYLVDLPGYGFARRSESDKRRWSNLTQGYFKDNKSLCHVLQLIDIKVGITADDADMIAYMNYYDIPYTIIATKCDKLNKTNLTASAQKLVSDMRLRHGTECILFSSASVLGREEVWKRIVQYKQ
ncbi:MAG: YihA family ribosome biogenesis GTP-binding protein [Clostridia bacterium]|nr:YihA family ribosome biogenesis GTP-binding protein [Clostridia bacterium]